MDQKAKTGTPDNVNPNIKKKTINATVAMFFDGTGNNMYNTDEADKDSAIYKKNTGDNSSYENSYSNVARLFNNYKDNKITTFKKYIEGIGTLKWHKDDMLDGTALGRYEHGITSRVREGCEKMAKVLKGLPFKDGNKVVETLTVDVFGFSRGAAAARHFVHEITKAAYKSTVIKDDYISAEGAPAGSTEYYRDEMDNKTDFREFPMRGYLGAYCKQYNIQINRVNIRFVGLFETVASYSTDIMLSSVFDAHPTDTPKAFKNDTKELHLNAIALAKRVVHLTAENEHRANFPLTNINSAAGRGTELVLPGVHSDVGGCYHDNRDEDIKRLIQMEISTLNVLEELFEDKFPTEMARLIKQGWYRKEELHSHDIRYGGGIASVERCLRGTRLKLRNTYSFIPLYIMCQFAIDFDKTINPIPFDLTKLETQSYPLNIDKKGTKDLLLLRIKNRLWDYAFNNGERLELESTQPAKPAEPPKYIASPVDATAVKPRIMPMQLPVMRSQNDRDLMQLRHGYLHWSANYHRATGMIIPNYPRMENGHRKRLVLPG